MTTVDRILKPFLARYAQELMAHGFTVYLFRYDVERVANGGKEQVATAFRYSRVVNGQTCYGNVQEDYFETVEHHMPIKPSREHGSSMLIDGNADLASAERCASPTNWNKLVGTHKNYSDPMSNQLYVKVEALIEE